MLRWIWAYLFDCVHSETTWPRQNRLRQAYVCCLDCGRELPYSLESMQIVGETESRVRTALSDPPAESVRARRILAGVILLGTLLALPEKVNAKGFSTSFDIQVQTGAKQKC